MENKYYFIIGYSEDFDFELIDVLIDKNKIKSIEEYQKDSGSRYEKIYISEQIKGDYVRITKLSNNYDKEWKKYIK